MLRYQYQIFAEVPYSNGTTWKENIHPDVYQFSQDTREWRVLPYPEYIFADYFSFVGPRSGTNVWSEIINMDKWSPKYPDIVFGAPRLKVYSEEKIDPYFAHVPPAIVLKLNPEDMLRAADVTAHPPSGAQYAPYFAGSINFGEEKLYSPPVFIDDPYLLIAKRTCFYDYTFIDVKPRVEDLMLKWLPEFPDFAKGAQRLQDYTTYANGNLKPIIPGVTGKSSSVFPDPLSNMRL